MRKYLNLRANIARGFIFAFLANIVGPMPSVQAQEFYLPAPGAMVRLSPEFNPPILKGIKVHPDNPFRFDFILDQGDSVIASEAKQSFIKGESTRLIKYFLASLTIPEKDLWVNLSPYEKNRIIPQSFGLTEMGRDLLMEDYMLKQITASLIYPEGETGRKFWKRIYEEAQKKFGTTNIPVNTFNKVWIVPDKAVVYENAKAGTAYVVESSLKVMLEQDYLSLQKHSPALPLALRNDVASVGANIIREIVIPELTKEVNENKNFAQLRQVYNSLILATWYKKKIKDSILAQVYEDKKKVAGVEPSVSLRGAQATKQSFDTDTEYIYQRYLQAFKKGAYNYIKEEIDTTTHETVPRKYFSGGVNETTLSLNMKTVNYMNAAQLVQTRRSLKITIDLAMASRNTDISNPEILKRASINNAMLSNVKMAALLVAVILGQKATALAQESKKAEKVEIAKFTDDPDIKTDEVLNYVFERKTADLRIVRIKEKVKVVLIEKTSTGGYVISLKVLSSDLSLRIGKEYPVEADSSQWPEDLTKDKAMTAKQGPITTRTFKSKDVQRLWQELQRARIETPGQLPAKYKGMTQMEIAGVSKVSPGRVSAFLNGARIDTEGMAQRRKAREANTHITKEMIGEKQRELLQLAWQTHQELPEVPLDWGNLALVPWDEMVWNPDQPNPFEHQDTHTIERYGDQNNLANYWFNQMDVRREFLLLLKDMFQRIVSEEEFEERFSHMHKTLLLGADEKTIYVPENWLGYKKINDAMKKEIRGEIAGRIKPHMERRVKNIYDSINSFVDNIKSKRPFILTRDAVPIAQGVKDIARTLQSVFIVGNTSLLMNFIIGMYRGYQLKGFSHMKLDMRGNFDEYLLKLLVDANQEVDFSKPINFDRTKAEQGFESIAIEVSKAMKAEKKEKAKAAEVPIDDGDEYAAKERLELSADTGAPHIRADQVLNPPTSEEILWARGTLDLPVENMPDLDEDTILWARLNKALALPPTDPKLKDIELAAALLIRSLSSQAMAVVPRRRILRDIWRGAGGLVIANALSGHAQAQTLKPAQKLELARMLIIKELERIQSAAPGDIDIISFTYWKDILDRRGVAAYGWDDISLVIEEGIRGGFVPQKSFDSREFARAALKAINDPQKRMEYFFKYTWDGFIKKQRTNEFKEGIDILRIRSHSINRQLGSMMDYMVDNLTVLSPDLQARWQRFNEEFLVPNNIYSLLNVEIRKDGFIYSSSTYGIERKSLPKRIGKKNITVIYGRYMSGNLESEADGISPLGENFVFINLSNTDKLVDDMMKVLNPGNQVENTSLWGEVTEAANRWIRREFAGMDREQIRQFIEKDVVNHELTHKTQEILNAAYVPVVNRFGVPEDVWSTMSSGDQKLVEMETLAYIAEIKLSARPNFTPFMLSEQLFAPVPTPTHYAALYLFNALDGRPENQWVKASDKQGLKELFEKVIFADDLQKRVSDLLQQGMRGMDLQNINQAMKADHPPKVFVITEEYKAKYRVKETGQIGDMKGSGMASFRRALMLYSNGLYALQVHCLSLSGIYHKHKKNITVGINLEVSLGLNKELAVAAFNDSRMDGVVRGLVDDLKQYEVNDTNESIFTDPVVELLADIEKENRTVMPAGTTAKDQSLDNTGQMEMKQPFLIGNTSTKKKIDVALQTVKQEDRLIIVSSGKEYLAPIVRGVVIVIYDKQGRAKGLSHLYTSNFDPLAFQGRFREYLTKDYRFLIIRGPQETEFQTAFIRNLSKYLETTKLLPENIFLFDSDKYRKKPYPQNILAVLEKSGKVAVVFTDLKGRRQYGNEEIIPADVSKAMATPENTGGIDLTPAKMNLQTKVDIRFGGNDSVGIRFHLDPAMLVQLQDSTGFVPVIISIQPMNDLRHFLGL